MHKTNILLCSVLVLVKLNFVHCCAYRKLLVIKLQLVLKGAQFESDLCTSANVAISLLTACMAIDQLKEQVSFLLIHISFYDPKP